MQRNQTIDLLRFIGLSLIILAHVHPPYWLFQLRNFDVPLVVMVSGMALAHTQIKEAYLFYVWKRIKRLVFPAWFFLSIYYLLSWRTGIHLESMVWDKIFASYMLMGGVDFLWIVRVFLLVALAAPLILRLNQRINSNVHYGLILMVSYAAYEVLQSVVNYFPPGEWQHVTNTYLCAGIGYSLLFALGVRFLQFKKNELIFLASLSFFIFVCLAWFYRWNLGEWTLTQISKHPPTAYYWSYAVFASVVVYFAIVQWKGKFERLPKWLQNAIQLVAQNSLWIYLWHIPFVRIGYRLEDNWPFGARYIFVYGFAFLVVKLQTIFVQKYLVAALRNQKQQKVVLNLLTG